MLVKIHRATRLAVAVCDSDLIGKKFEEGERQLDLTGQFFLGEEKTGEEVKDLLNFYRNEDACFNIVGNESCKTAIDVNLIFKEGISKINGIPFALVLG